MAADPDVGLVPEERRHCQTVTQTSKPYSSPLNIHPLAPPSPLSRPHPHTVYKPIQVWQVTDSKHMFTIAIVVDIAYLYLLSYS